MLSESNFPAQSTRCFMPYMHLSEPRRNKNYICIHFISDHAKIVRVALLLAKVVKIYCPETNHNVRTFFSQRGLQSYSMCKYADCNWNHSTKMYYPRNLCINICKDGALGNWMNSSTILNLNTSFCTYYLTHFQSTFIYNFTQHVLITSL